MPYHHLHPYQPVKPDDDEDDDDNEEISEPTKQKYSNDPIDYQDHSQKQHQQVYIPHQNIQPQKPQIIQPQPIHQTAFQPLEAHQTYKHSSNMPDHQTYHVLPIKSTVPEHPKPPLSDTTEHYHENQTKPPLSDTTEHSHSVKQPLPSTESIPDLTTTTKSTDSTNLHEIEAPINKLQTEAEKPIVHHPQHPVNTSEPHDFSSSTPRFNPLHSKKVIFDPIPGLFPPVLVNRILKEREVEIIVHGPNKKTQRISTTDG